jgi:hypothetical protein
MPPKSISVAALVGAGGDRIIQAHRKAVEATLALVFVWTNVAFAQPTLQFELVKYDYPSAPTYAAGEPEYYQRVLAEESRGGPVVPGWLVANWLWDMVPTRQPCATGKPPIPQARLNFCVKNLIGCNLGFVKIKGYAVDQGTGYVAFHFDQSGVAFCRKDFCTNPGMPTDFSTQVGGATVVWLGYFPDGMTNIGMYLIVRVKGVPYRPRAYEPGKSVIEGYRK